MKQVIENADGTVLIDGEIYDKRQTAKAEPPKVTLSDVFNKVKPFFYINETNEIIDEGRLTENEPNFHNQLPTERDAKRVQAFIALINCAKYFNGEWDGIGKYHLIYNDEIFASVSRYGGSQAANVVRFATEHGATETVRILKEAGLYEYLFLETK
jgi:hypothetical protein